MLSSFFPLWVTISGMLVGWTVLFLSLAVLNVYRRRFALRLARGGVFVSPAVFLLFAVILAVQIGEATSHENGVVMSAVVTAKNSPDQQSSDAFVIHEGLKVQVGDTVGGWTRITLADGKVGWILNEHVERI